MGEEEDRILGQALALDAIKVNQGMTHAEFVAGMEKRTIGVKFSIEFKKCELFSGLRAFLFKSVVVGYFILPWFAVPLWSWHEGSWWLLIGILASQTGTAVAHQLAKNEKRQSSYGGFLLLVSAVLWIFLGIHNYWTFLTLCAFWGFLLKAMADGMENDYALDILCENETVFNLLVVKNEIKVVRHE